MASTARIATEISDPEQVKAIELTLQQRIGPERYDLWFDRKTNWRVAGNSVTINAGSIFAANWIRSKFIQEARAAARDVLCCDVEVHVAVDPAAASTSPAAAPAASASPATHQGAPYAGAIPAKTSLNPRYVLEEFIAGPCNQLALQAAHQAAENPGKQFNPLFIHGSCGLGKTHLLQAICQRFSTLHPRRKFLYLTAEQFTNDFLESLRGGQTDKFRKKMRGCELLAIDDVHFLANKKATQEEFLHTFNQVDNSGRQVVLASDCAPRQIHQMAAALTSRFSSGMVVRVDAPDMATRLAILRRRAQTMAWNIPDAVLAHIAQSVSGSVRELDGMLVQVVAGMQLLRGPEQQPGQHAAVLSEIRQRIATPAPIAVSSIVETVAEFFSVTPETIHGATRDKHASLARASAMFLARRHTGMSFPEIGKAIGDKKHSTVIAACQRVEAMLAAGALFAWRAPDGARRQAAGDAISELESALRRRQAPRTARASAAL